MRIASHPQVLKTKKCRVCSLKTYSLSSLVVSCTADVFLCAHLGSTNKI